MKNLHKMLTYCRPAYGRTEAEFCQRYLAPIAEQDCDGNWYADIPMPDGSLSRTLWSSHTDTVHRENGRQKVIRDGDWLCLPKRSKSTCLGADCTAGVWLMLEMYQAGIPGLYVWHAAEEIGGIGSRAIAKDPKFLRGIDFAIAFDRRGKDSIVTHQFCDRTCSDRFACDLADMLGLPMLPDDTGIFTDTANYAQLVPECTNLSVGYENAHGSRERLHVPTLVALRDAIISSYDEAALAVTRDPLAPDDDWYGVEAERLYADSDSDLFLDNLQAWWKL